ncbi:unnamed protein product [Trifolium pratense]|uniref:Uncharacterized protein n=1 Tax=Trifolium pratense TaxID=57577 RepID=A0ACB0IYN5_TRIPR|nr:unnamed protein product [Trifolium pratense]
MDDCKPMNTPMHPTSNLGKSEDEGKVDQKLYRGMIGSLLYLIASRPDILFSVCLCARFQSDPRESHLTVVKRIFRYLKGTTNLGLIYKKSKDYGLVGFCDADYAGDKIERKSTSGNCQFIGENLISWASKRQTTIALSTAEAEYISAAKCCTQLLWIKYQLEDYQVSSNNIPLYCDNTAAIQLSKNPILHSRAKHIEIKHHFIRDYVQRVVITQTTIAELLKIPNEGFYIDFSKEGKDSPYANMINRYLYETEITEPTNKTLHLKKSVKVLVKIMQGSIFPRSGGTDQVSWNHRHFLYFLYQSIPLNLAAYIFNQMCASIRAGMAVRNPSKKIVYPRLISELFHQCTVVRRIQEAGADYILTTARGTILTGKSLKKMNLLSEPVKYPNLPLLENHSLRPINEVTPMVFEDEPKEVIQNYIKEMIKQGKIVCESDVGKSSKDGKDPRKRRRVRCQSEETIVEQPNSKVIASDKGKGTSEQVVIKDVPQKVTTAVKIEAVKRITKTEVKGKRKLILPKDDDDEEETDDEEPQMKRTRKVSNPLTDANVSNTGNPSSNPQVDNIHMPAAQLNSTSTDDIVPMLLKPISVVHPSVDNMSSDSSDTAINLSEHHDQTFNSLQNLEQHLQGDCTQPPTSPKRASENFISTDPDNPSSNQENIQDQTQFSESDHPEPQPSPELQNTTDHTSPVLITSDKPKTPSPTVELSPQSSQHTIQVSHTINSSPKLKNLSQHSTPKSHKQTIPQTGEPSSSKLPHPVPPISSPELADMCNIILLRIKDLHHLRHSFVDLDEYMAAWEKLKEECDQMLSKVQNGDVNELIEFQLKTKQWVKGVNLEFEQAQMRRKGRFSISNDFFNSDVLKTEVWKENIGMLDRAISMHLKFSMEPGPLFVKKDHIVPSELSAFEAFKLEVNGKLKSMKEEQEAMNARQAEMGADLKKILNLLSQKPLDSMHFVFFIFLLLILFSGSYVESLDWTSVESSSSSGSYVAKNSA